MEFAEVKDIVLEAGSLLKDREAAAHITVKGAADFVTEADRDVQNFIQKALGEKYPEIQFLGEEKNNDEIDFAGRVWVLDPVDGTTNLIHDYRRSSISLALMENGQTVMGVVYQPYTGELFDAQKGKGAFLNGRQIHVSRAESMEEALIAIGTSPYEKEKFAKENFRRIYSVFMDAQDIRRSGSAAIDLAEVAAGRIDGFFEPKLSIWDYAAGRLLVAEAGGRAADFAGGELGCRMKSSVVSGNPAIHELLLQKYMGTQR